ncbi:uncharacterized protein LOC111465317 [Cucurbita maxima]|uniref:Uncharacterized protein LOC111465317 n=1 Tax=Cucurbita maxima TaxID=3661 RepID=A0A6J1HK87_CUCMA|nr:uncharacterized protein LOC111465317 [Cucurbita maxima]XP_022965402.1 uncharacterized protein LOC111465317 [Cucurbita maxima]XP_022965403.1 uncharacterized protein LOC111465317 [Cucurbita maxima]
MEAQNQKSLERVVSQKALQLGSSFPCQICVVGFLCGVCIASLFLGAFASFGAPLGFGWSSLSSNSLPASFWNSTSEAINCNLKVEEVERPKDFRKIEVHVDEDKVSLLYAAWSSSLTEPIRGNNAFSRYLGLYKATVPNAPHLEDCKLKVEANKRFDERTDGFLHWTSWKGFLDMHPTATSEESSYLRHQEMSKGSYPPWVTGSDEENYPLTRKVQRDLWIHQHPLNCRDPNVRFLVADWERLPGFGIGAQIAGMCGLLAIAINEKRVLVTNYYNRADHDGCQGSSRSSWSCYFFPETSQECRDRAFELLGNNTAWKSGIITAKENYSTKEIWTGRVPRIWGNPWSYLQPTTEVNGSLLSNHRKMDRRWWRAQAVRYLMRFQTEYTCGLMNAARHAAFGKEAAEMVLKSLDGKWPKNDSMVLKHDIEEFVWSNHKPWIPRPLLSMHVRMGDKACEMKVVEFEEYMALAGRIRRRFPNLDSIWLSTEMQEVIDKTRSYPSWKFYYTNVKRQVGNLTMATYEAQLGRITSTNYPLVNFLMATEADFFIGALGSTWCFLIDGMRNTGGKVMAGYLSVNKDRFW